MADRGVPAPPQGVELLLEPDAHAAAKQYKAALARDGIPIASFQVADVQAEHERLTGVGVRRTQEPTHMGSVVTAVLDDTCAQLDPARDTAAAVTRSHVGSPSFPAPFRTRRSGR